MVAEVLTHEPYSDQCYTLYVTVTGSSSQVTQAASLAACQDGPVAVAILPSMLRCTGCNRIDRLFKSKKNSRSLQASTCA